jgi:hypothetical protein
MSSSNFPGESQLVTLRRWRIIEVEGRDGTRSRHVFGHDVTHDQGRASSSIVRFEAETLTAVTRSGTHYRLIGLPGNSRHGANVWEQWCQAYGVVSERDVTGQYLNIAELSPEMFARLTACTVKSADVGDTTVIVKREP